MAFLIDTIDSSGLFAQSANSATIATKDSNGNDITATYQSVGDYYSASNPSGFITGVDLSPYQTKDDMSAYQPSGDYVSATDLANYQPVSSMTAYQESGDYYSASNPSGFISELPASATEAIDAVTANSGAWGGSALPISAGPGIKVNLVNNTLVFSNDETVLWSGDKTGTGTITLSEGVNNFERLAVYIGSEALNVSAPQKFESLVEFGEYSTGNFRFVLRYGGELSKSLVAAENSIYVWGGELVVYDTSYTTLNVGRTNRAHLSNITTIIDHSQLTHIRKVIGVNRIAGGN